MAPGAFSFGSALRDASGARGGNSRNDDCSRPSARPDFLRSRRTAARSSAALPRLPSSAGHRSLPPPRRPARTVSARSSRRTTSGATLPDAATIAARAPSLWRYREWLPFDGEPVVSLDSGFTPLLDAPALARRLGVARVWVKNDAVSHPSLSFKDRVVAVGPQRRARAGPRDGGLRLDRQSGQRGRGAGRPRRPAGLDLHPARSRARQGRRDRGVQPAARARARHLRRREPTLLAGGRPLRVGPRQHQPSRLLRRRLEDDGVRDRRAAGLAAPDGGRGADGRGARC